MECSSGLDFSLVHSFSRWRMFFSCKGAVSHVAPQSGTAQSIRHWLITSVRTRLKAWTGGDWWCETSLLQNYLYIYKNPIAPGHFFELLMFHAVNPLLESSFCSQQLQVCFGSHNQFSLFILYLGILPNSVNFVKSFFFRFLPEPFPAYVFLPYINSVAFPIKIL